MSYVAVDLETTGLDPGRDRVIEVGAVTFTEQDVKGRLSALADPGRTVPDAVQRLTGIDPRALRGQPPSEVVLDRLVRFMDGSRPVGHGVRLEVGFLTAAGYGELGSDMLDTLDLARILLPRAPSHSLPELARELGLSQPSAHRAFDDADATRQLLLRLLERVRHLPPRLLERMQRLCEPYPWRVARFFGEEVGAPRGPATEPRAPTPAAPAAPRRSPPEEPDRLAALLGPEGPLARALPDFEYREGQVQMLLAVAQAMWRGRRLVVEAGTGTGKSLAYLIPAAARAVARGERVVIATHTHTLQEQLLLKDLPALRAWLPWDVDVALLKGRSNYLSLRRWRRYLAQPCEDAEELCFKLRVMMWLEGTTTGDRAELRLAGRDTAFWQHVASDPLDCVGIHCTPEECFVHRARAEAEEADLVIVNHALLLADAQLEGGLIPDYQHLVVDEAHHLEQAATDGLRADLDRSALIGLLDRLASVSEDGARRRGLLPDLLAAPRLGESIQDLTDAEQLALRARARVAVWFTELGDWVRARNGGEGPHEASVRLVPDVRAEPGMGEVKAQAEDAATALAALEAVLRRVTGNGRPLIGGGGSDQVLREIEIVRGAVLEAARLLDSAFRDPDPDTVYWVQQSARADWPSLRSAPLSVASLLHDQVFDGLRSVIATSASLALERDFRFFLYRTGIGEEAETMVVASPFDYLRQALLCLPTDMPPPDDERFQDALPDIVADVARRAGGGTLVLFTSHQQLKTVNEALHHRSDLDDVRILAQGVDGPRRQLLQTFAAARQGLLLGTASFWEGIDLPGDQLRCVVVVRLPFPVPTEPVYAARAERLRDPFRQLALPQATLRLKQGFGRLIRRREDRGAVVILDARVLLRDYGRAFLDALPQARRLQAPLREVGPKMEAWLAR